MAPEGTLDGVPVFPLRVGAEVEVPEDVALIIETGCTECDGPTEGLVRVYRDASGELRTDTLFERPAEPPATFISSFALSPDASTIVVGVCPGGICPFLAVGEPDAETVLYRSTDGGVTWEPLDTPRGVYDVRAVIGDNVILQGPLDEEGLLQERYQAFPGGALFEQPVAQSGPFMAGGGAIVWLTAEGRLLRTDGGDFVSLGDELHLAWVSGGRLWFDPTGGQIALVVYTESTEYYLGLFAGGGEPMRFYLLEGYASVGGWLGPERLIGNVVVPSEALISEAPEPFRGSSTVTLPAVFDLRAGLVHPIAHPFLERYGRNRVVGLARGPFLRVEGTGDCLNVRAEPDRASQVLACVADGVLLRDGGERRDRDGERWWRVATPQGTVGWASAQYLSR